MQDAVDGADRTTALDRLSRLSDSIITVIAIAKSQAVVNCILIPSASRVVRGDFIERSVTSVKRLSQIGVSVKAATKVRELRMGQCVN